MATMSNIQVDETSCGPLCQHPQCWASNRRVERGLPRLDVLAEKQSQFEGEGLPTLKVQNMLDDYGLSGRDHYPSTHHVAISSLGVNRFNQQRRRSASAPSIIPGGKSGYLQTPYQSAESSRSSQGKTSRKGRNRSRSALLEPIKGSHPPKLSNVHLNQLCGPVHPSNDVFMGSQVYVWQPSNRAVQKRKEPMAKDKQSTEPRIVSPKDMTETLLPSGISEQKQSTKKIKNKRSKQTPTGGRPYTHPSKSPPAITRRTLPADVDEGIAQLLSLPREVMLEILEHTKESDLFDKGKVQALLARVMPHVHFDNQPAVTVSDQGTASPPPPPLHAMGLLRNQKMSILEGRHKFEKTDVLSQNRSTAMPLFLDDPAMSATSFSYQGRGDEGHDQQRDEDGQSLMPAATTVSEGLSRRKNHLGAMSDVGHLQLPGKMTSVSAKSLPPLKPGVRGTKPFNYTTQPLDLALTPLPTPENQTPEEPSTPRSGKASTLYVTLPSEMSEDRIITPVTTAKHPHLALLRQDSQYNRSMTSSHASEEFPELHWFDYEDPSQAMSPSYSTRVPKAPYGTPATAPQASFRENTLPSAKTTTSYDSRGLEDLVEMKSRKGSGSSRVRVSSAEQGLHTIHEHAVDSALSSPDTVAAHPASVTSPSVKPPRSVSPWETSNQLPRGRTPPPVARNSAATPTPSNPSPDVWPVVDERSYLHSPEAVEVVVHPNKKDIPETVAPPPSPEPRAVSTEPKVDVEPRAARSEESSEELKCTGISLTTLTEEEDDDKVSTDGLMIQRVMEVNLLEAGRRVTPEIGVVDENGGMDLPPGATSQKPASGGVLPAIQEDAAAGIHSLDVEGDDDDDNNNVLHIDKLEIDEK